MKFFITVVIIWLLMVFPALAASTGVSASRVIVRTAPGEIVSRNLVVSNLSAAAQQYRLSLESGRDSGRLASFIPSDFNLPSGKSQRVLLRFRQSERSQQAQLAVLSYDGSQSGNLKIASGIKIPVYFIVPPSAVIARESADSADDRSNLINTPSAAIRLLRFARNDIRFSVFTIDFILFSVVCFLYQRRIFWRRRLIRRKINFI